MGKELKSSTGVLLRADLTAIPTLSEKLPKWHFFTRGWNLNFWVAKWLNLKGYESAILWFYPKCVSGLVHVHVHVDKSEQMELSQKSLTGIKKIFLSLVPMNI